MCKILKKAKKAISKYIFKCLKGCDSCMTELDEIAVKYMVDNSTVPETSVIEMVRDDKQVDSRKRHIECQENNVKKKMRVECTDSDWDFVDKVI